MRSKEDAHDYRYFPDPDLLPVRIDSDWIEQVRSTLPELPQDRRQRYISEYGLSPYDAAVLTASREIADYFDAAVQAAGTEQAKLCANWINGELAARLNKSELSIGESPVSAQQLAGVIARLVDQTISGKIAKQVFDAVWQGEGDSADAVIEAKGLKQVTDSGAINQMIDEILAANTDKVAQYQAGKEKLFGFFVGQVMKASQGKANPAQVNQMLKDKLG